MMDMENGTYPNLNRTGSIIRELVKNPVRVEDIVRNLMARFSIDEGTCTSEMINFLSKIANQEALMLEQGRNEFCIK